MICIHSKQAHSLFILRGRIIILEKQSLGLQTLICPISVINYLNHKITFVWTLKFFLKYVPKCFTPVWDKHYPCHFEYVTNHQTHSDDPVLETELGAVGSKIKFDYVFVCKNICISMVMILWYSVFFKTQLQTTFSTYSVSIPSGWCTKPELVQSLYLVVIL